MGIFSSVKNFARGIVQKAASIAISGTQSIYARSLNFSSSKKSNLDLYEGWVYACIRVIAESVAKTKFTLSKTDKNGNKEHVVDHPALRTLKYVNEYMDSYTLFERLQSNLEIHGNEFWYMMPVKNADRPFEIYPLNPLSVSPLSDPYEYVKGYRYKVGTQTVDLPVDSVIHFKNFNPRSDIWGMGTIEAARLAIETNEFAGDYNRSFFENSAQPGIILEVPGELKEEESARLKAMWNEEYQGYKKNYRTAVAANGLKITKLELSHADMQFIDQQTFTRDQILALFRVPKTIMGILEDANYAGAKTSNYVFALWTLDPKLRRITNTLNEFYLSLFDRPEGLVFEYEDIIPEDKTETTAYYNSGMQNGWLTPNEIRQMEGLPPLQSGDQAYLPFSLTPYSAVAEKAIAPKQPESAITKMANDLAASIMKDLKPIPKEEAEEAEPKPYGNGLKKTAMDPEQFEKMGAKKHEGELARAAKFDKIWYEKTKELFDDQKKRAIESLNESLNSKAWKANAPNVLDVPKEVKITIDLFTPIMNALVAEEGQEAYDLLNLDEDFDVASRNIQKFIEKNTKKFAGEITQKTSQELRALISAGLESGAAIDELTAMIAGYAGFGDARAETIARTEVTRGQTDAELAAWKESGVVVSVVWYTAQDERVEPECESLHGTEINVGDDFVSVDELEQNGVEPYLGAIQGPPLHPNCRCTLLPIITSKSARPQKAGAELMTEYLNGIS